LYKHVSEISFTADVLLFQTNLKLMEQQLLPEQITQKPRAANLLL